MQFFRNISIKQKLILLMMLVSGAVLLVASTALVINHYASLRRSKVTELVALADVLASNSTAAISFHQKAAAEELLASLAKRPTVEYACLFDGQGELFADYRRHADARKPASAPNWTGHRFEWDGHLTVALPVTEDGEILGTIYVHATTADLHEQFYRDVGITFAVIALSLAIAVVISTRLQRVISEPILGLADAAQRITEAGDYSIRVEPKSTDEIGNLVRQFNLMLQRIQTGEEELRRLSAIIEATSDLVGTATPDGKVTYINRAGRRLLGIPEDEKLTGTRTADIHPEWAFKILQSEGIPDAIAKGTWEGETALLGPGGEEVPTSQVLMSHKSPDGKLEYLSTIMRDITDRNRAQREREELITKLETQNAELERFTYTVSHDLKSPLITISGYAGMLRQDLAEGDSDQVENDLVRISDAATKMEQLLRDVLELSRIGRLVNPPKEVSLDELAREALALVSGQVKKNGVQVEISPDMPVVFGDRLRLLEVLQNLIDNAAKYMGDQAEPRVEIGSRRDGNETVCYVRDNGIGIDPRYHEKAFGLFDQLDPKVEGTGIGLALVKRIVEVHGGRIWVESKGLGHGSTFCFTLAAKSESTQRSDSESCMARH